MTTERRYDRTTAEHIKTALRAQRQLGFEPAFLVLRAQGVDVDLARAVLGECKDRRSNTPPAQTSVLPSSGQSRLDGSAN